MIPVWGKVIKYSSPLDKSINADKDEPCRNLISVIAALNSLISISVFVLVSILITKNATTATTEKNRMK